MTNLISGNHINPDDGSKHQEPAKKAIEQEFHGCSLTRSSSITTDKEINRNQHCLEEHIEEEDIGRREDPNHHRLQDKNENVERLDSPTSILTFIPSSENDNGNKNRRKQNKY